MKHELKTNGKRITLIFPSNSLSKFLVIKIKSLIIAEKFDVVIKGKNIVVGFDYNPVDFANVSSEVLTFERNIDYEFELLLTPQPVQAELLLPEPKESINDLPFDVENPPLDDHEIKEIIKSKKAKK